MPPIRQKKVTNSKLSYYANAQTRIKVDGYQDCVNEIHSKKGNDQA